MTFRGHTTLPRQPGFAVCKTRFSPKRQPRVPFFTAGLTAGPRHFGSAPLPSNHMQATACRSVAVNLFPEGGGIIFWVGGRHRQRKCKTRFLPNASPGTIFYRGPHRRSWAFRKCPITTLAPVGDRLPIGGRQPIFRGGVNTFMGRRKYYSVVHDM